MKLIYKTTIPLPIMIVVIIFGIANLSESPLLEQALMVQNFDHVKTVAKNALLLEMGGQYGEGDEEEPHDEAVPPSEENGDGGETASGVPARTQVLEARDFISPGSPESMAQFRRYIEEFKDPIFTEINVFNRDGQIIASSVVGKEGSEIRTEALKVFDQGEFYVISEQNDSETVQTYVPFTFGSATLGAVEVKSELDHVLEPLREEMGQLAVVLVLLGLVAMTTFYFIENQFILKPIYYLRDEAQKINLGNLDSPIKLASKDELGALAGFFESMRQSIKSSFDKLSNFNNELEKKVKEKTAQLQEEQAKLVASLESLKYGFVIIDTDKKIILSNQAASKILETSNIFDFQILENYFGSSFNVAEVYASTLLHRESHLSQQIDTHAKFLKVLMAPVIVEGAVIGTIIVLEDVTEEVLLQRKKEEFFAVASHELRTPLTSIRGNMALIKDYYQDKIQIPEVMTMITQAHQSSIGLLKIVNDFLDAARLEQGKGLGELKRVDLSKVVREVVAELALLAKNKGISLTFETGDFLPEVSGDELRLREVAYNLIGNGLNYTEKGEVKAKVFADNDHVRVEISDTGVGITPQNQKLLFQKFQQAGDNALSRAISTSSIGMGLYVSKLLVDAMHGEIGLLSSSSSGSTFFFSIPIAK